MRRDRAVFHRNFAAGHSVHRGWVIGFSVAFDCNYRSRSDRLLFPEFFSETSVASVANPIEQTPGLAQVPRHCTVKIFYEAWITADDIVAWIIFLIVDVVKTFSDRGACFLL